MDILTVPLIIGIALAALGIVAVYDYCRFTLKAEKAHGVVTHYDEHGAGDNANGVKVWYRPHFQFTVDGTTHKVISKTSYPRKIVPVGRFTRVLYQKGDEANAKLARGYNSNLGFAFLFLSLPAIFIGIFVA